MQELKLYGKDQEKEAQKVASMKAANADTHDIKHAVRCQLSFHISNMSSHLDITSRSHVQVSSFATYLKHLSV